jgi:hypothetical protein
MTQSLIASNLAKFIKLLSSNEATDSHSKYHELCRKQHHTFFGMKKYAKTTLWKQLAESCLSHLWSLELN